MKKILTVIILALAFVLMGTAAYALDVETQIAEMATKNEKVIKAECIVYQRTCVVAIKTEKFSTKTEYETYRQNLIKTIKDNYEVDNVIVTRNPKVMAEIERLRNLSEEERSKEIEKILERELQRCRPPFDKIRLPKPVQ